MSRPPMKTTFSSTMQSFSWWAQKSTMPSLVPYKALSVSADDLAMLAALRVKFLKLAVMSLARPYPVGVWSGCLKTEMLECSDSRYWRVCYRRGERESSRYECSCS